MSQKITLLDKNGKAISATIKSKNLPVIQVPKQNAMGLYGNIYSYGQAGRYKYRYYTLSDNNQGLDSYSRELLVRWGRECAAQLPIVSTAIKTLAQFSVGDGYMPEYVGNNPEWGKLAIDWLTESWYPNCCTRGNAYPFTTCLSLFSQTIDTDGDFLQVFGTDKYGFPMFQIIPTHRIKSTKDNSVVEEGPYKGCMISDGIVYTTQGKSVGYVVQNVQNMVNTMVSQTSEDLIFDVKDSRLIFDVRYFDKNRGIPAIGPAILQALSIQELQQYTMDKLKIESMIGLIQSTPSGESPQELQDTLTSLLDNAKLTGQALYVSPNDHAVQIINGPEINYVRADGGDIKTLASSSPANEMQEYMNKLETEILSCLGVPHQLLYTPNKVGGRITSATAEVFRKAIKERQKLLDTAAKFTVAWALSKAMEVGLIPRNDNENMIRVIDFTHEAEFSLDAKYDADIILNNMNNGVCSLNDVTTKLFNKTSSEVVKEQADEQINFYKEAKRVAEETGIDLNIVIANWKETAVKTTNIIQTQTDDSPE